MENQTDETTNEEFNQIPAGEKLCPLMNGFYKGIPCTSDCALYREGKNENACALHELRSISWFMKQSQDKKPID
ncbi:MAG: hypothetical protein Q7T51_01940 [Candidatus Moranbacteria bacterium]|nr:hypothetical protein [Candidatus Moranbacteria bacterium]